MRHVYGQGIDLKETVCEPSTNSPKYHRTYIHFGRCWLWLGQVGVRVPRGVCHAVGDDPVGPMPDLRGANDCGHRPPSPWVLVAC